MIWPAGTIVVCIDDVIRSVEADIFPPLVAGNYYTVRGTAHTGISEGNMFAECRGVVRPEHRWRVPPTISPDDYPINPRRFRIAETKVSEIVTISQKEPAHG
jgi:hypothetical protein